jgi:hypothetical protein
MERCPNCGTEGTWDGKTCSSCESWHGLYDKPVPITLGAVVVTILALLAVFVYNYILPGK